MPICQRKDNTKLRSTSGKQTCILVISCDGSLYHNDRSFFFFLMFKHCASPITSLRIRAHCRTSYVEIASAGPQQREFAVRVPLPDADDGEAQTSCAGHSHFSARNAWAKYMNPAISPSWAVDESEAPFLGELQFSNLILKLKTSHCALSGRWKITWRSWSRSDFCFN